MIDTVSHFNSAVDTLRGQFRELSMIENDLKRDLAWAEENLKGVRELKRAIQQQIFELPAVTDSPLHNDSSPTSFNGPKIGIT